jgi:poly(beta-D-mannuronate) lyase
MPRIAPMVRRPLLIVSLLALALSLSLSLSPGARAAEFLTHSAAEITAAVANSQPGDTIIMADGDWTNQSITFNDAGTAANPITLRAQTPGRVILNGTSKISIGGDYTVTDGLNFIDGTLTSGNIISLTSSSSHSRVTNCALIDYDKASTTGYHWFHVDGDHNRIDHNFFKGHVNDGVTLEVNPQVGSQHQIDHNQFVDRPSGSGNGFETIRLGTSGIQTRSAQAIVEDNLFERVDGELEIISNKTSNNIIRDNTIRASDGTITLRHGQGSRVEGNFFLGENKAGSGGVRVIGPNHVVQNNYFQDLDTNALSITTGYTDWDVNTTATGYEPVNNVLIAHNTVVNVTDQIVSRDAGYTSGTNRTQRPANVTMANNLMYSTSETLIQGTEGDNWTWAGNIAYGTTVGKSGSGIINSNPNLVKDAYGIWRPAANSPAINAAAPIGGIWTAPTTDMDGQTRTPPNDIGADETNGSGAITSRPLYGGDVGPAWLTRRTLDPAISSQPILRVEAENYTAVRDPNGDGDTWSIVDAAGTSGGKILKAPPGSRTDVPAQTHDAIVEYDVAFHDAGTYLLYALCRGPDSGSNSLYLPTTLGAEPTINVAIPDNGLWSWVQLGSYSIAAADVNRPLTLELGRRERDAEIDALLFSPVALNLSVPEPGGAVLLIGAIGLLRRTSRKRRRI